jgi:parallel beta-helix repeat protein
MGNSSWLVYAMIILLFTSAILILPPNAQAQSLTTHDPIFIENDDFFNSENGVNGGGTGTVDAPYIIENWAIDASSGHGIRIENTTKYFIIRNCLVENGGASYYGIYLENVINGRIENNVCENNQRGIVLSSSSNNTLINNTCENNSNSGIYLIDYSDNNILNNNTCFNNSTFGIYLNSSSNSTLDNNTLANNKYNFSVEGSDISHFVHDIDNSNLVDGRPIVYLIGENDLVINQDNIVGYLGLVNCDNIRVENLVFENNGQGVLLAGTENSWIENLVCSKNCYGIWLFDSDNNTCGNNICGNNCTGISLVHSSLCNIENNTCENNSNSGIYLIDYSDNNILNNNTCSNNGTGIWSESSNSTIFHNYLLNNENNAQDSGTNCWDNGSEGNWWSDWQPLSTPTLIMI